MGCLEFGFFQKIIVWVNKWVMRTGCDVGYGLVFQGGVGGVIIKVIFFVFRVFQEKRFFVIFKIIEVACFVLVFRLQGEVGGGEVEGK